MGKAKLVTPEEVEQDFEVVDVSGTVPRKFQEVQKLLKKRAEIYDLEQLVKEKKSEVNTKIAAAFEKAGIRKAQAEYGQIYRVESKGRATLDKRTLTVNLLKHLKADVVERILVQSTKPGAPYTSYTYKPTKEG